MRARLPDTFKAETDLCKAFIDSLEKGWTPYPETAGFDILLVRIEDGFQIGVQAKLKLTALALAQGLEGWSYGGIGPDCRAVLVPDGKTVAGVETLAGRLAITVIRCGPKGWKNAYTYSPRLPALGSRPYGGDWHELVPLQRCKLPDYVPDVAAGASAPVRLTEWKIRAIKISVIAETKGFVTRADFKALHIDHRRWIDSRWMVACEDGFRLTDPDWMKRQHPKVYEQIKAEASDWMPKVEIAAQLVLKRTA